MAEENQQLKGQAHTAAIAALEVVPFAMLIADSEGNALAVNQRWLDLADLTRAGSLGAGWLTAVDSDSRSRLHADILRVAAEGTSNAVDYQLGSSARRRWTRWWISRHELDGLALVAVAAADVEDDYARQANLYHLATHDSLTGLINRSHFLECIDQALRRNERQARHVGVVYVDLDGFKGVNDRGGHSLGDRVLFAIAGRLRHAVRSADMVARIGGDEFAVLCEGLNAVEQAEVVARRIAVALTESVELDGERWAVAASVGAAVDQGGPDTAEELIDRADRAMYTVKLSRRTGDVEPTDAAGPAGASVATALLDRPPLVGQPLVPAGRRASDAFPPVDTAVGGAGDEPGTPHAPEPPHVPEPAQALEAEPALEPVAQPQPGPESEPAAEVESEPVAATPEPSVVEPRGEPELEPEPEVEIEVEATRLESESVAEPEPVLQSESAGDPAGESIRHRLAHDVRTLQENLESIRRMLDRLLSSNSGVIDIRDRTDEPSEPHSPNQL